MICPTGVTQSLDIKKTHVSPPSMEYNRAHYYSNYTQTGGQKYRTALRVLTEYTTTHDCGQSSQEQGSSTDRVVVCHVVCMVDIDGAYRNFTSVDPEAYVRVT